MFSTTDHHVVTSFIQTLNWTISSETGWYSTSTTSYNTFQSIHISQCVSKVYLQITRYQITVQFRVESLSNPNRTCDARMAKWSAAVAKHCSGPFSQSINSKGSPREEKSLSHSSRSLNQGSWDEWFDRDESNFPKAQKSTKKRRNLMV